MRSVPIYSSASNAESDYEFSVVYAEIVETGAGAGIVIVVPRPAADDAKISHFLVVPSARPFPDIAHHIIATRRANSIGKCTHRRCSTRAEFRGVATRFVDFVAPRKAASIVSHGRLVSTLQMSVVYSRPTRRKPPHLRRSPIRRDDPLSSRDTRRPSHDCGAGCSRLSNEPLVLGVRYGIATNF